MTPLKGGYYMQSFRSEDFFALVELLAIEEERLPEEFEITVVDYNFAVEILEEDTVFAVYLMIRKPDGGPIPSHIFDYNAE